MQLCTTRFVLNHSMSAARMSLYTIARMRLYGLNWETLEVCIITWVPILHSQYNHHFDVPIVKRHEAVHYKICSE